MAPQQRKAFVALVLALGGFVAQTQFTHQILTVMNYSRPFFVIYVTQSVFTVSLLVHLIYLALASRLSISKVYRGLKISVARQLRSGQPESPMQSIARFPYAKFVTVALALTAGFSFPSLLWAVAISLSSASDVTVLWNTNAFFAYLISVTFLGRAHQRRKFAAVVLATIGVVLVVYGGADSDTDSRLSSRLIGDLAALLASISYAGYQLFYDSLAEPPSMTPLDSEATPLVEDYKDAIYPPPYGLESSFWTSVIGFSTFSLLWVAFPFLQFFGLEEFSLPDLSTMLMILAAAVSGATFMTGTMMLLASWGAVQVSITSLLTTVLVFLTDFLSGTPINFWSVVGSVVIIAAWILVLANSGNSV
ncbi:hypothetical protein GYMLUDRAFT_305787 [Collybiopsis luxurians FD-317 M1]|nr:hypothetical protein GYMLUDRAFT_305787 [Collybiopsis luxurians FD-317 M1]